MSHPQDWTLRQQADAIRRGDLNAKELLQATLERIAERDPLINSTPVTFEEQSYEMLSQAPAGPLHGVPITVKDMFALPWRAARNGTSFDLIPASASGPFRNLRDAGMVVAGIANQHELGMGTTGAYSAYGPMGNPWAPDHCAGGSSGGSAAAVAARLVAASLGSDSGGSTRIPASYCGVVGLKTTYGAVAYDGYFGAATTFSAPGIFARDGGDVRMVAAALLQRPLPTQSTSGLRVGVVRAPYWNEANPEVTNAADEALKLLGWRVHEIILEHQDLASAALLGRLIAEAGVPPNELLATLSAPTRALLLAGMLAPARFVPRADRVRAAIRETVAKAFQSVDFIVWPTSPATAPTLEHPWLMLPSGHVAADTANVRQASLANLTGAPAISVPIGLDASGLPIGLQLLAPWGADSRLIDAAEHLEKVTDRRFVDMVAPIAR